jgi:hypothetical protein
MFVGDLCLLQISRCSSARASSLTTSFTLAHLISSVFKTTLLPLQKPSGSRISDAFRFPVHLESLNQIGHFLVDLVV